MRLLILAGTAEARSLAEALAPDPGYRVTVSLAGATRAPAPMPAAVAVRSGGFGGAEGLTRWLRANGADRLIDATHPFAARMPWNAHRAAEAVVIPRLRLIRPPWPPAPNWALHEDLAAAARALPAGARVLLATGRGEIAPFAARTDCRFWLRSIEDPGPLPGHIHPLRGRPPYPIAAERALMAENRVTHLIVKNAGGDRAKLDAAAAESVTVMMIARPAAPPGPRAESVEAALAWLRAEADFCP